MWRTTNSVDPTNIWQWGLGPSIRLFGLLLYKIISILAKTSRPQWLTSGLFPLLVNSFDALYKEDFRSSALLQATILSLHLPHPPTFSHLHAHLCWSRHWFWGCIPDTDVRLTSDSKCGAMMALINILQTMNLWYVQVKQQQKHSISPSCSVDLLWAGI